MGRDVRVGRAGGDVSGPAEPDILNRNGRCVTLAGVLKRSIMNAMPSTDARSLLFVCMGNICRSPAAEGVLKHLAAELGLDGRVEVDSAGTIAYHAGKPPDPRMRLAAEHRGIELNGRSRPFEPADAERFDLVVAMDRENLADIDAVCGERRPNVRLFSDFLPAGAPLDIPDPYYGGARGFEVVLDLLEQGCPAILESLLVENTDGR